MSDNALRESEGYTFVQLLDHQDAATLVVGQVYRFRASISKRPPPGYAGDLVRVEELPPEPGASFYSTGLTGVLEETGYGKVLALAQEEGGDTVAVEWEARAKTAGSCLLYVRFYSGDERLQVLNLPLVILDGG